MAKSAPQRVLTIQSHVTFGHVGNDAAVFTLQRLGIEAMPIHTVQFSNHTGYEIFTGEVFGADHIEAVMDGLVQNDLLNGVDAVLSGYLGSVAIGRVIHRALDIVRSHNPQAIYVCDPVMGDKDDVGGFFVDDTIPPFMQKTLAKASIITPNHFEFEVLCGRLINTLADAVTAARALMAQHDALHTVLITSFREDDAVDELMTLAITPSEAWCVTTPRCDYLPMPSGMGDTFSALYLGHILNGRSIEYAIRYTTSALYAFVMDTDNGARDLSIIREQAQMIEPLVLFDALHTVLITSFREDEAADKLMTLAITPSEAWCVTTPRCDYLPMPSGMGDTFSALYLGHILNGRSIEYAIRYTTSALYAFVMDTDNGARDLSIIREQAQMIEPLVLFDALPIV